ncbi:hypothetical protein OHR68_35580 [Spirillospora sp. NBC_00431]
MANSRSWIHPLRPRHGTTLALDISGYSGRDEAAQTHTRSAMFSMFEQIAADLEIRWRSGTHCDRGDGLMIVVKRPRIEVLVTDLPRQLGDAVRRHNLAAAPDMRMRLRMALDAGFVHKEGKSYTGDVLNRTARLLDAPEFKTKMRDQGAEFAVIASAELCEAIQGFHLLDDRRIEKVQVDVKETHTTAWMWTP